MRVSGVVRPPGDKSITHRVLMLASLIRGTSVIRGPLTSADARSTAACLRLLGTGVGPLRTAAVRVRGGPWRAPSRTLHCGNSGTSARLLLGLLAGHDFEARLTGDRSLRRRPMRRVTEPLARMGARIVEERGETLPLAIRGGNLRALDWTLPVATAQVKTALLFAGLVSGAHVRVAEPVRSRDHTERLLAALGAPITVEGTGVSLAPTRGWVSATRPLDWEVAGDPSSAAFLVGAALLAEEGELTVEGVCLNPTRIGYLAVLERMGAWVRRAGLREAYGEPVGSLVVRPAPLRATAVEGREIPSLIDEVPVLAVLASRAVGESVFHQVGELRVKESDRLRLLAENLRAVGAEASVEDDTLRVVGTDRPPRGHVETAGDHRLAMAFALLERLPGAAVTLSERASPGVSFPDYFATLDGITGHGG